MKPFLPKCIILLFAVMMTQSAAHAHDNDDTVRVAIYDYPPLYHRSETGKLTGSIGQTFLRLCEVAKLTCQVTFYPLSRAYEEVLTNKSHVTFSSIHPRFDDCCTQTKWEYPWNAGLFTPIGLDNPPQSEEDLIGKRLIMVNGWRSPYRFIPNLDRLEKDNQLTIFRANDIDTALRMLDRGRANILWGSVDFSWHINRLDLYNRFQYHPRVTLPITIWINKSRPHVIDALNKAYQQLLQNNELTETNLLKILP